MFFHVTCDANRSRPLAKLVTQAATSNDDDPREEKRRLAACVEEQFERAYWEVLLEIGCVGALWLWALDLKRFGFRFQTARPKCPDVYEVLPEELKEIVGCGVDSPYVLRVSTCNNTVFGVALHFKVGHYPKGFPTLATEGVSSEWVRQWMADRRAQKAAEAPAASAPVAAQGV